MTKEQKYKCYKKHYLKHHHSKHGLRSFNSGVKKNYHKNKNNFNNYYHFACDFETTYQEQFNDDLLLEENQTTDLIDLSPKNNASRMFLSGIGDLQDNEYKLCFENIPDTFNGVVQKAGAMKKRKLIMGYHNLAFDGHFILKGMLQNGGKQSLKINDKTKQPKLNRKEFSMLMCGGKFFNLTFIGKGIKIMIFDSLKILPQSLASLGEVVGYKKLKETIDYTKFKFKQNHEYPETGLTYLKRDCEILAAILKAFFKSETFSTKRLTIGSISFQHIANLVKEEVTQNNINDFYFGNQGYRGGLCFPSIKYQAKGVYKPNLIKMVDACSMYPSQMIKALPTGEASKSPNLKGKNYCCFYKIKINQAKIKDKYNDIAIIPKNYIYENDKKKIRTIFNGQILKSPYEYVQETTNGEYHVIDKELEIWKQLYDLDYEILETYYFQLKPFLKSEVEHMFIEKQKASRANDPTSKIIAKLKLNNLYGKLGQKPIREQTFYGTKEQVPSDYEIVGEKHTMEEAYNVVLKKDREHDKAKPVFLAAYITALARVSLLEKYKYITDHGGTFLYCDTDSICYVDTKKGITFNDIGDSLGCGEYEKDKETNSILVGDGFCSLCPKQYRIVKIKKSKPMKFASAGLTKEVMSGVKNQHYNFDLDTNTLYKLNKKKLKDSLFGKIIEDSPFSFKKGKPYFKKIKCPKELWN